MNHNYQSVRDGLVALYSPYRDKIQILTKLLGVLALFGSLMFATWKTEASTANSITLPLKYTFSTNGILNETSTVGTSGSPYWWVSSGGEMIVNGGLGQTFQGNVPSSNKWNGLYAKSNPIGSDTGIHPQNIFQMFLRSSQTNLDQSISVKINQDNLSNSVNRNPWNGVMLTSRWQDNNNYYYAGVREDGHVIIKKKVSGIYYTLAEKSFFSGTYNSVSNPNLIPKNTWLRMRNVTYTDLSGKVHIELYLDTTQSGNWQLVAQAIDDGTKGGVINKAGLSGIRSDFMDIVMDNYSISLPANTASATTITLPPTQVITSVTPPLPPLPPLPIPLTGSYLLSDSFSGYSDGVITNEYAYWNPQSSASKISAIWELDSGSLFAQGGTGWTGVPDNISPNALSTNGNNSAVFRLTTKESDFANVAVSFDLLNQGLSTTGSTPATDWDGLHIFLRYQNEYNLYYTSINRRDNKIVIKKKVPGGPSNGGTYYELTPYISHTVTYNSWQNIKATAKNNADGSVTIELWGDGKLLASANDNGSVGGAPIRAAGKIGLRGDNANLKFKNFSVSAL